MKIQTNNFGSADHFRARLHKTSYNYELHLHQFAELMLVLDGEIEVNVADRVESAHSGQFILIFPFQPHSYATPLSSGTFCAVFSPSLLPDFFAKNKEKVGNRAVFDASPTHFNLWLNALVHPIEKDKSYSPDSYMIKSALYAAISDFSRQILLSDSVKSFQTTDMIIAYLSENCERSINLSDMAKALGYAENYLSHKITALFGMNFPSLLACFRIEHAKRMLRQSDTKILNIAYECGFGSERSFNRTFKKITNQTPSEYRSNL